MTEQTLNLTVELRKHIGQRKTPLGTVDVEHDQWIVIVARNGVEPRQVGYLPHREGSTLLWLSGCQERFGTWLCGEIEKAVDMERARIVGNAAVANEE
jgi:hypothetical protein